MSVVSGLHDYIAGGIGGVAGIVTGHPFDTVKVQLQTQGGQNKYSSLLSCIQTVRQQNLAKGFFRGLSWPLLSYGVINSVYFGVYGKTLHWLNSQGETNLHVGYIPIILSGAVAGVAQLTIACPIDVIKVVLQAQIPRHTGKQLPKYYNGPIAAFRDILKIRGFIGLYRGFGTQFVRDIPASAIYMFAYEYLRTTLSVIFTSVPLQLVNFVSGGTAGVVSWMVILPLDVVKSRLQADTERKIYKGFWDCAINSYRNEGVKVFFRGGIMVSIRAFLVNSVTLMTYSECMKLFNGSY